MLKKLKISTQLFIGFGVVFALFGIVNLQEYTGLARVVERSGKSDDMQSIVIYLLDARRNEKNLLIRNDVSYREKVVSDIAAARELAISNKEQFEDSESRRLMDDIVNSLGIYEHSFLKMSEVFLAGNAPKSQMEELDKQMVSAARQAQENSESARKSQMQQMDVLVASTKHTLEIFLVVGPLAGLLLAFMISRNIVTSIGGIVKGTQGVAEGNLAFQPLETRENEVGRLGTSFNSMIANIGTVVRNITATAAKVSVSTYQIHSVADQISKTSVKVANEATEVALASKEMASTSVVIANNCQLAAASAQQALESAQNGAVVVENSINVMKDIATTVQESSRTVSSLGERSKQIGTIISSIKDIAGQTNLLALNAAIEAARAGDNGRGFAVVADEVRALSERTTAATHEISQMISAIQNETVLAVTAMERGVHQVESGTAEAACSGEALRNILNQVNTVAAQVRQIAAAADEQTATTEAISRNIDTITATIRVTSNEAKASALASSNMNGIAEELMAGIGKFKVQEDAQLAINKAKSAHMIFIGKIKAHLDGAVKIDVGALPNHHTCAFGKWFQSQGQTSCSQYKEFSEIDAPHAQVHELGKQAVSTYNAGKEKEARDLCEKMEQHSIQLVNILNNLSSRLTAAS